MKRQRIHSLCQLSQSQRGVGLIEVLVALLLFSIGFVGVAALQTRSLATNNRAMARSMATVLSYSILDSMRLDRSAVLHGDYNVNVQANLCPAASTGSLVKRQLRAWCFSLANNLGKVESTQGSVHCDGDGNCQITIRYQSAPGVAASGEIIRMTTKAKL